VLVVAVNSDASTRAYKGPGRPYIPESERAELVAALACTDRIILFDEPDVRGVIRALKPDVHVKGTDYTPDSIPEADEVRAYGGRTAVAGDPKNHSTTEIAQRTGRAGGKG
jgi:rfaE bifunctional protein nucleotidyltransferase chain/domain